MKQNQVVRGQQRNPGSAARLVCYATRSGGTTLDTGEGGGNPFASALIEVANDKTIQLRSLITNLRKLTAAKSHGHQIVECSGGTDLPNWQFQENLSLGREKRSALVLIVSDYSLWNPMSSLIGAARDERRIAAMLAQHGFSIDQGIGPRRHELIRALLSFKRRSFRSDVSVVYSTGHGVELNGNMYLLPGDYPMLDGFGSTQLRNHALSTTQLVHAACACKLNMVFFAGCRTHACDIDIVPPNQVKAVNS